MALADVAVRVGPDYEGRMPACRPLSIAVLLELERSPRSGGHVKCWEQLAAAAAAGMAGLDLTVYVLGRRAGVEELAGNVRFIALRPVLSTGILHGVVGGVDAADLAPFHPALARRLSGHDVVHLTHSLSFANTALHLRRRLCLALTGSVHTDVPMLTGLYTRQVAQRLPAPLRLPARALRLEHAAVALARRRRDRVLRACSHLLASNPTDAREFAAVAPGAQLSMLRRGVDPTLFSPHRADRRWLAARHGVPEDRHAILFAGRVDVTKGVPLLAEATLRLVRAGMPAQLVLAGSGAAAGRVAELLGDTVTLLGHLPQEELARVYASCDVLAFPSRSETAGNVVAEAMAAGLPVVLPAGSRTVQWLTAPGEDGLLVDGDEPAAWADTLGALLGDPPRRRAMGARARETVERRVPTWSDVLRKDVLPVWRAAAALDRAERAG